MDLASLQQKVAHLKTESAKKNAIILNMKAFLDLSQDEVDTDFLRDTGLEMVVACTESQGGYLHFFDEQEQVIDLAAWSSSVKKICDAQAAIHYPIEEAGIWADCARQRKTVVHNAYQDIPDEDKGGLPEGHFPLYRHMSCPVFDRGKLVCIIGVGNKESDYTKLDVEVTEILSSIIWIIFQQRKAREVLEKYSFEDPLTGIGNRRRFDEVMAAEWNRLRRIKKPLALIMFDIDFFKKYNDSVGHSAGDACLTRVAKALQKAFRRTGELVIRFGGEEFIAIVPYCSAQDAAKHAELARKSIEDLALPHPNSPIAKYVTVSVGVASMIPNAKPFEELIKLADKQLYQAKSAGRNKVCVRAC